MQKLFIVLIILSSLSFNACQNTDKQADNRKSADSMANATASNASATKGEHLCFELRFKEDISELKLTINGDDVTGELNVLPFEKDAAIGTLKAKKTGNVIRGEWNYVIEGSNQSEEVEFKIEGDKALQRLGELEDKNGKLVLKETAKIEYSDPMKKVECK